MVETAPARFAPHHRLIGTLCGSSPSLALDTDGVPLIAWSWSLCDGRSRHVRESPARTSGEAPRTLCRRSPVRAVTSASTSVQELGLPPRLAGRSVSARDRRAAGRGTYRGCVASVAERLHETQVKTDNALDVVRADPGASPVLIAVVSEFAKKAEKATRAEDERGAVIELEQAGDSAKAAAEADTGVSDATRQAVLDAHLAICIAKAKL